MLSLPPGVLQVLTWSALALELGFAPLALVPRLRPWLWASMLLMHLGLILVIDFADLSLGMVMLHLFTFDPAWMPQPKAETELLGYDGGCGLCHRAVRFILAEDRSGAAFRFAPLDSAAFRNALPEAMRSQLPDSFVVLTADRKVLTRSAAVRHLLYRLGGLWRVSGVAAAVFPTPLLDRAYDLVARIRGRLFSRPAAACPLVPPRLRERFSTG
jgi:predicted DCC family thiol-disulfide oxidoreductase YuxK